MSPAHQWLPRPWKSALKTAYDALECARRERGAERALRNRAGDVRGRHERLKLSLEKWEITRAELRQSLAWMLGVARDDPGIVPPCRIAGTFVRPRYTVENLVLETVPGLQVTANLYLPRETGAKVPVVVYLNGHWPSLDGAKTGYQDRYLWYPAHGFALLVLDPSQFGEIPGVHQGTNRLGMWHWLSLGYTPAGVEVWNAMRAIDWLCTHPDIDGSRIGVTGISGGGVMTQYLAALDERVTVAAASCSTYTIEDQIRRRLVPEQCDCTFFPNVFGLDFPDVLALVAPRPLLILGGRKDPIFPPSGFRDAYRRAKRVYDLFAGSHGGESRIRLAESAAGHTDPPHFLRATRRWMAMWLGMNDRINEREFAEASPPCEPPASLRCLDQPPGRALNYGVHEVWVSPARTTAPTSSEAWGKRRLVVLKALRERVFGWVPQAPPPFSARRRVGSGGYAGTLATYSKWEIQTEVGVRVVIDLVQPREDNPTRGMVVWIRRMADHVGFPDLDEFLPLLHDWTVAAVTPRFAERPMAPARYAELERSAALMGRTLAAMHAWDALRVISWVRERFAGEEAPLVVYGRGETALTALLAGAMDERVTQVIVSDPPTSLRVAPPLLTLWRDVDVPEIAGLIAPRKLTFVPELQAAFEVTRRVFEICGAAKRIVAEKSIAEAVAGAREADEGS